MPTIPSRTELGMMDADTHLHLPVQRGRGSTVPLNPCSLFSDKNGTSCLKWWYSTAIQKSWCLPFHWVVNSGTCAECFAVFGRQGATETWKTRNLSLAWGLKVRLGGYRVSKNLAEKPRSCLLCEGYTSQMRTFKLLSSSPKWCGHPQSCPTLLRPHGL